jgi:hypothetical protein
LPELGCTFLIPAPPGLMCVFFVPVPSRLNIVADINSDRPMGSDVSDGTSPTMMRKCVLLLGR